MGTLQEMRSFIAVVEAGSFVGAADATGLSKQAVSRHISELEKRLGIRLIHRTTRRLSLTTDGHTYFGRAKSILSDIAELEAEVTAEATEPTGRLRVNAPLSFGLLYLAPLWGRFAEHHPKIALEVYLSDRIVDLIEEGYDLAVRIMDMPSSTLVSRRLAWTRTILCASPDYLRAHGIPKHPEELKGHRTISYTYLATGDEWGFTDPAGQPIHVRVNSQIHTNSGDTCRVAALNHQGIVLQPDFLVGEDLNRGDLVEVMPDYRGREIGIYAVYPARAHVPLKTRRLIDYLANELQTPRWRNPSTHS